MEEQELGQVRMLIKCNTIIKTTTERSCLQLTSGADDTQVID